MNDWSSHQHHRYHAIIAGVSESSVIMVGEEFRVISNSNETTMRRGMEVFDCESPLKMMVVTTWTWTKKRRVQL